MSSHHSCSILYKLMVTTLYDAVGVNEWVTPGTPYQPRFTCYWALEPNDSLICDTRWQPSNRRKCGMICNESPVDVTNACFVIEVTPALSSEREYYVRCHTASRAYNNSK